MTPPVFIQASTGLLLQLVNFAVRSLVLAGVAGLGLALFRSRTTSSRLFTWTAVLYAALAMPLLQWILPPLPLPTPVLFRFEAAQGVSQKNRAVQPVSAKVDSTSFQKRTTAVSSLSSSLPLAVATTPARWGSSIRWSAVISAIYLFITFVFFTRFFVGLALSRRLLKAAHGIDEPRITARLASRAYAAGLAVAPNAAESEFISVPVTMGVRRSSILLPEAWREWDDAKLDAVVAHEMSHVARRDALTQRLSLLHRAIFWFSPLAWWLDRRLADLAEQASDEAALSGGVNRRDYARTLLGFFEALQAAPGRVWWHGVSMAKAGQAEQRMERILSWKGPVTMDLKNMNLKKSVAALVVMLAVPVIYLSASVHPVSYQQAAQNTALALALAPAQASRPASAPQAEPAAKGEQSPVADVDPSSEPAPPSAIAPAAPRPTAAARVAEVSFAQTPLAPVVADAQSSSPGSSSGSGYSYSYGYDHNESFAIVSGKSDSLTMSGREEDAQRVEELRKTIQGDFIWFLRGEKSYIIRDQATIDRARKLWAPQAELGKKQEELGKMQEALGQQQDALGARMEEVHVKVPDMTAELEKLKTELKELSSGATVDQVGHIESEIGELQSKLGDIQSEAGDQQSKLGEQMGALGEKQGKLGEQQGELGRIQGDLAQQATRQMKQILDEAITKGTAVPEKN
jgi:beta-lactamase regulating signal transducer with metallopeptidase domain